MLIDQLKVKILNKYYEIDQNVRCFIARTISALQWMPIVYTVKNKGNGLGNGFLNTQELNYNYKILFQLQKSNIQWREGKWF